MNLPGIQNVLANLTAPNQASGSKAPSPGAMRAEQASFRQALSQEVAQRAAAFQPPAAPHAARPQPGPKPQAAPAQPAPQQAARPPAGNKVRDTDKADQTDAPAQDAAATATADAPAASVAKSGEAKPDEKPADPGTASLADIPGAPQAALMMQLMNMTPATTSTPAADTAPALDAAPNGNAAGTAVGKDAAAQGPVDLRAVAGKNAAAATGPLAARDAAGSTDLQAAFGKAMNEAGQQPTQALAAAQAETPGVAAAPAALAALQAAVQAVHAPPAHVDKLLPAVGTPAWDQALGQKIVWMSQGGEQSATLTMNPPDLGPMQVVLSVTNNQATVDFMAAQPEVRQALENALPRLREMMGESGVQLGQANVSAGGQQQFAGFGGQNRGGGRATGSDGMAIDDAAPQLRQGIVRMSRDGAVDTFA